MKINPLRPFITDADDLFTFPNLEVMKQEIQAISGVQYNQMLRLYRFDGSDKARIHYRIIEKTNDGTGVAIRINTSKDPKVAVYEDAFANIAHGFPYYIPSPDGSSQLVYWDGERNVVVGEHSVRRSILNAREFNSEFRGNSGFYPTEVTITTEPVFIQFIENGKVNNALLPEALKTDIPDVLSILLDSTHSTNNSFKITATPVERETVVNISYKGHTCKVTIKGGARG